MKKLMTRSLPSALLTLLAISTGYSAQQTLTNAPGMLTAANANFTELYKNDSAIFNVVNYGANTEGLNLSATTAAIQAAYTAACANTHAASRGGIVFYPPGTYRSGPVIQTCSQVYTAGAGRGAAKIDFVPTGNSTPTSFTSGVPDPGSWLTIANSTFTVAGGGLIGSKPTISYYGGVRDIRIATDDLTFKKNAIFVVEASQFDFQNIVVDKFWGNNSAGLRLSGHETTLVQDSFFSGTIPVWIMPSPETYGGVKYNDNIQFVNVGTRAPHGSDPAGYYPSGLASGVPNTNYLIEDGVWISNLTMDRMSWVGGANAVYWKQTLNSVSLSYRFSISNGRKEQSEHTNIPTPEEEIGFVFDFTGAAQILNDVRISNVTIAGTNTDSGIYARRVSNLLLENFSCAGYTANSTYVMDVGDVYAIKWINVQSAQAGNPSTINLGANTGSLRNATFRQNVNLPISAEWVFESAPRVTKTLVAGSQGNWVPSTNIGGADFPRGLKVIYLTSTAGAATLTGLPAPVSTTGLFMYGELFQIMVANGGNKVTLPHNSGSETTAANRWEAPLALDTDILPGQSRLVRYDYSISRYVIQ